MHKKFLRTLVFIVGMTFTLGASPTIAMDNEKTPLTTKTPDKVKRVVDLVPNKDGSWNAEEGVWHPLCDTHIPARIRRAVQAKKERVPQNLIRASLPLQIAEEGAQRGDANYQMEAGLLFLEGQEIVRDEHTAAMWLLKASNQSHAGASLALGLCLECGYGVDEDLEHAKQLYRLLSSTGHLHPEFSPVTHAAEARLKWLSEQKPEQKAEQKCCTLF